MQTDENLAFRGKAGRATLLFFAAAGLCWYFASQIAVLSIGTFAAVLLALPLAASTLVTLAALLAAPPPASSWILRWRHVLSNGLGRGWPITIPFAALPLTTWVPSALQDEASAVLLLVALLGATWLMTGEGRGCSGLIFRASAPDDAAFDVWRVGLLCAALSTAIVYLVIGSRVVEITQNDGAYYYGVARHMALSKRFEEPIVWHFLRLPEQVIHEPFDYWGPMTSLLLVPPMLVFGAQPETAFLTIAVVSAASLIAFWYLVCVALPLRYWASQLLALLLFAFSPAMIEYRFQPESIAIAQLFTLVSLVAFCRRRFVLAALFGFCIGLARGDGFVLFGLILLAILVEAARSPERGGRLAWAPLVAAGVCVATYIGWSLTSFGTMTPPGPRNVPQLRTYWAVFNFGPDEVRPHRPWTYRFTWDYLTSRIQIAWFCLRRIPFAPWPYWMLALVPPLLLLRRRRLAEVLIWCLFVVGLVIAAWLSGPGFYLGRAPYTFVPLAILAGALGADALLAYLDAWVKRGHRVRIRAVSAGAAVFGACCVIVGGLPLLDIPAAAAKPSYRRLVTLDQVLAGQTVASNVPWYMIAYTESPTVSIPFNGEKAIEAVLDRYDAHWLVVFGPPDWVRGKSRAVLERILAGEKTSIGRFHLRRVKTTYGPAVFRVEASLPAPEKRR